MDLDLNSECFHEKIGALEKSAVIVETLEICISSPLTIIIHQIHRLFSYLKNEAKWIVPSMHDDNEAKHHELIELLPHLIVPDPPTEWINIAKLFLTGVTAYGLSHIGDAKNNAGVLVDSLTYFVKLIQLAPTSKATPQVRTSDTVLLAAFRCISKR
eukprot:Gregarina_sp_Poly_1__10642@NODE_79_length_15751_cov_81_561464_g67_i0_p9_GENE_NODE_79_length_15751_cov_81_561464_g67_i0NODE_79_length_15751_cov_81_561464_g67_i0_p9_ORF_typecomplete_len157_score21_90_NODE_79_length_15751_cov_81_561464_g67_i065026972